MGPQEISLTNPFGFFAILVNFWGWQNFTENHSSASVKCAKHDEMQFESSWTQLFEGQPPTIEWAIVPPAIHFNGNAFAQFGRGVDGPQCDGIFGQESALW